MDINKMDEKALRKYLLGRMSEKRQEQAELWLMSSEESCDLLDAAEDDLIDDFLSGTLNSREREQFMQRFLASPERKRKLQFGGTLKRFVERAEPKGTRTPEPLPIWQKTGDFFSNRLAGAFAMAAMAAIFLIGAPLTYLRIVDLGKELDNASAQLSSVQQEYKELEGQLGASQSLSHRLQSQFQRFEQAVTDWMDSPNQQTLLTQNLNPGVLRSSNRIPSLPMSPSIKLVKFSLTLLDDYYDSYSVTLFDAEGSELWAINGLKATATSHGQSVVLTVPGELLPAGEYNFSLAGMSDTQPPESINRFYFRSVTR